MSHASSPLRVAVVGSGPSGFYAVEHLLKRSPGVLVDLFDRPPPLPDPAAAAPGAIDGLLAARRVRVVDWADWQRLDRREREAGQAAARPRVKFTRVSEMLAAPGES
jgi:ferredoxin--NADP+ reductase